MHPNILKNSLLALNEQFTHLINMSIQNQKIPTVWKTAKVIPIPKTGDLTDVTNFRPISLLPTPGKVLERIVHNQIVVETEELITNHQYGFRKGRSTTQAITQIINHIYTNFNTRTPTVALFIDFRKAFDCLQYPTLIAKLRKLNLAEGTLKWVTDYLKNRSQSTLANGRLSASGDIKQGVPQGSILGPLLYILYANDISEIINKTKVAFYADDTVLYTSSKNLDLAMKRIQEDLNNLLKWCTHNDIHINPTKTKYVIFSTQEVQDPRAKLKVRDMQIERVNKFSYLGVILDQHLSFDSQAKHTINRVSAKVCQLRKMKRFLTNKAALLVYKNMILPILEYGDIYLMSASKENRSKLQKLQNKALKCALDKEKRYNTTALHKEAKLDKLRFRRKFHMLQHMHHLSQLPNFSGWKAAALIRTRSSKKKLMKIKKPNLTKFQNSITYRGPRSWNALPEEIQKSENHIHFKMKLEEHMRKTLNEETETVVDLNP